MGAEKEVPSRSKDKSLIAARVSEMADPKSYNEILEDQQMILELIDQPDLDEDERQELVNFWMDLKSREAYKFDAIISVIRECDNCIDQVTKELAELSDNAEYWKKKRQNVINIIKVAYQNQLISSKPTGVKYQATIRPVKPKVEDNFDRWTDKEIERFSLKKTVTVSRVHNNMVVDRAEEVFTDKDELRRVLIENPMLAPDAARLVKRVSLCYGLRKRLQKGV
jgi:flagellar biosynthesis chaperone FliJ